MKRNSRNGENYGNGWKLNSEKQAYIYLRCLCQDLKEG